MSAIKCKNCNEIALYGIEGNCRVCYWPNSLRSPNVIYAERFEDELKHNFQELFDSLVSSGEAQETLDVLLKELGKTKAVVAVPVIPALILFFNEKEMYTPYLRRVDAGTRASADEFDDKRRLLVDTALYGNSGADINFAMLSLNGRGLSSWGSIYITLKEKAINMRATVLEDNSFDVVRESGLAQRIADGEKADVAGKIGTWSNRDLVAFVKMLSNEKRIKNKNEIVNTLFKTTGDREKEEFLEVHIFGNYNHQAIERVVVDFSVIEDKELKALAEVFYELVKKRNHYFVEEIN